MEYSFPRLVSEGIQEAALAKRTTLRDLEVNISKEIGVSLTELESRQQSDSLDLTEYSREELAQLHRIGAISTEEYVEAKEEIMKSEDDGG